MPPRGNLSSRVLVARQPQGFSLCPQLGDVAQVFGVYTGLLEEPPRCLHLPQALLGLVLAALPLHEPLVAPDTKQRLLRERKREVALHPRSAPRRQAPLERDGLPTLAAGDAAAQVQRRAAPVFEAAQ